MYHFFPKEHKVLMKTIVTTNIHVLKCWSILIYDYDFKYGEYGISHT